MAIESKMNFFSARSDSFVKKEPSRGKGKQTIGIILGIIFLFLFVVFFVFLFLRLQMNDLQSRETDYQAVFLDNGQVYFGKLVEKRGDFYRLKEVYYVQQGAANLQLDMDFKILKLGNEVHGPEDFMDINQQHILFVEDMKSDSKVVQAILEYLK